MAGAKSIGNLHAEVTANAAKFVDEFNRADKAAKHHGHSIREEVEHTIEHIGRSFTAAKFAHGVFAGFGLGSGAAAVEGITEKFKELIHEPAEDAKKFAEYLAEALKSARELAETRLGNFVEGNTPGRGAEAIEARLGVLRGQLEQAEERRAGAIEDLRRIGTEALSNDEALALKKKYNLGLFATTKAGGDAAQAAEQSAFEDAERLEKAIDRWEKTLKEIKEKKLPEAIDKALDDFFKPLDAAQEKITKGFEEAAKSLTDKVRTPAEKYADALAKADQLLDRSLITGRTYDRAQKMAEDELLKDSGFDRYEKAAGGLKVDELTKRGLGSGADYQGVEDQSMRVLKEIRDGILALVHGPYSGAQTVIE
jgi:hypothetical protein